jgi:putative phosphoserine phosphatase/1-acylglycerol-3-phosphate O-acyltransferase
VGTTEFRAAAFIDLDRTLISQASGPLLSAALRDAGVVSQSRLPGEEMLYRVFNVVGETLPSMLLARQGVAVMKGKPRHAVIAAANSASAQLMQLVHPKARAIIEGHRRNGVKVVLATTTPHDLIATFARSMGFDDVVATRFDVDEEGLYTGKLIGPFAWSAGKLEAVKAWCQDHSVSLAHSYAYSDSVYDAPLLDAVGFPHVVNPDPRLTVMATAKKWPTETFSDEVSGTKIPVNVSDIQKLGLLFARPEVFPFAKTTIEGIEHVPQSGPVILVANHRSYFDVFAVAMMVARTGRTVRFLGKKEVFDAPLIGQMASLLGGIRVDRASGSDEPLDQAAQSLTSGEMVAIMPQGTIPRGRAFFDPVLRGRWGAARLAMMTNATVIPIGLWGTEKVWPRSSKIPDVFNLSNPPLVSITVGAPVSLDCSDLSDELIESNTQRIMDAISQLLPPQARQPYEPTDAEMRATYPSGYIGDPDAEAQRRPGTD